MPTISSFPIQTKTIDDLEVLSAASSQPTDPVLIYDESVGVWKVINLGDVVAGSVTLLDSVTELALVDGDLLTNHQPFQLKSFSPTGYQGGGLLLWDSSIPKLKHDGERYFSPSVPSPTDYNNSTQISNYKAGVGEMYPTDDGVFVLTLSANESVNIDNVAKLSFVSPIVGLTYNLKEYISGTGIGGGQLLAKSGVVTANNVTTFASATSGIYFERLTVEDITIDMAGYYPGITNAFPAIQRAIDAAKVRSNRRVIGYGVCETLDTLVIDTNQVTFNGSTTNAVTDNFKIIKKNAGDALQITGDQCSIAGVSIYHEGASGRVVTNTGEANTLDFCTFKKEPTSTGATVYFNKSGTYIRNCYFGFGSETDWAIVCDRTTAGGININSRITDNYIAGAGNGVIVGSSDGSPRPEGLLVSRNEMVNTGEYYMEINTVLDLTATDNMFDGAGGIYLNPMGAGGIETVKITGRYLSTGSYPTGVGGGVCIKNNPLATVSIKDLQVSGVRFAAASYGVNLTANTGGGTVNDVTIERCHFEGMDQQGIYMKNVNNGRILNSDFADTSNNLTLEDGTLGNYTIDGNRFNPASTIARVVTNAANFTWGFNTGIKTKGYGSATVSIPASATETFLNVPHGLNITPDLNKVLATAILVSGDCKKITPIVRSVGVTNVVVQLNFDWVSSSVIRVNVQTEI